MAIARRGSTLLLLVAACAGHPNGVRPAGDPTGDDGGSPVIGPDAKVLDLLARLPAGVMQRAMIRGAKRAAKG